MVLLYRTIVVALLLAGGIGSCSGAGPFALPPVDGELSGNFKLNSVRAMPELAWKVGIETAPGGMRHVDAKLIANGIDLHATAEIQAATGEGTWEIAKTNLDAAAWIALAAARLQPEKHALTGMGKITVSGHGTLKGGDFAGVILFSWSDGSLRNSVEGWSFEGIALNGSVAVGTASGSADGTSLPWDLAVRTITTTRFGARNLKVAARLNENKSVSIDFARVELAGGEVNIDPATIAFSPLVVDLKLHIDRIGLQDLVALVPTSLADAQGRIDGFVRLGWSNAAGLQIGEGWFALREDEVATLRLVAAPGFLTGGVPEHVALLPKWTGSIGGWFAPVNPVYGEVHDIELGRTPLEVSSFNLLLTPKGDSRGRTARLQVSGRPDKAGSGVKLVQFEVNVQGPLTELVRVGMGGQVTLDLHR
jgi:hypothetical protein